MRSLQRAEAPYSQGDPVDEVATVAPSHATLCLT